MELKKCPNIPVGKKRACFGFPELAPLNSDALTTVLLSVTLDKLLSKSILFKEDNILLSLFEFSPFEP